MHRTLWRNGQMALRRLSVPVVARGPLRKKTPQVLADAHASPTKYFMGRAFATAMDDMPSAESKKRSPLMLQYDEHKAKYPDYILFMRVGDFYEFFYEDAVEASRALDIVLTKRSNVPMAGVPVHLLHQYLGKLVKQGFKAAICDQVESADEARKRKGPSSIIRRDVVRLITPGTITDDFASMEPGQTNYLACVVEQNRRGTGDVPSISVSWLDICSGEFLVASASTAEDVEAYLAWMPPSELLMEENLSEKSVLRRLVAEGKVSCPISRFTFAHTGSAPAASSRSNEDALMSVDFSADPELIARVLGPTRGREDARAEEAISGLELRAASSLLQFVDFTQKGESFILQPIRRVSKNTHMFIDAASRMSLNLTVGNSGAAYASGSHSTDGASNDFSGAHSGKVRRRSLASMIDRTCTSMGARLLYSRLSSPLTDIRRIEARLDAVDFFRQRGVSQQLGNVRSAIAASADAERALQRLSLGRGSPSDLVAVASSMCHGIDALETLLATPGGESLQFEIGDSPTGLLSRLLEHHETFQRIVKYIRPTVVGGFNSQGQLHGGSGRGAKMSKGAGADRREIIRRGWSPEVDRLLELRTNIKGLFRSVEKRYKALAGIETLKIKFNQALGYHVEVPMRMKKAMDKAILDQNGAQSQASTPAVEFLPVQSTRTALRFKTDEIMQLETEAEDAHRQLLLVEFAIFTELRESVVKVADIVLAASKFVAEVDVAQSTSIASAELGLVRPEVLPSSEDDTASCSLELVECRHLLVEDFCLTRGDSAYVPNTLRLHDSRRDNCWFITGPNMGGKSTFLRSVAHAVCMAQAGIFVPAQSASIGVVDQLFSRVGASDDLSQGKSTFLVEMEETSLILNKASPCSLVIVDEIGRGTSHKEGYAIAGAVLEELCGWDTSSAHNSIATTDGIGCRTLFATHYHDLLHRVQPNCSDSPFCVTPDRVLTGLKEYTMETVALDQHGTEGDQLVVHTHRVVEGAAQSSYAMHVAKSARLPASVCNRAQELLNRFEDADAA